MRSAMAKGKTIRINLGCGKFKKEGYLNIDWDKGCDPDMVADAMNLPLPDGSVEEVYSKNFLEHFTPDDAMRLFKELNRVLMRGGRLEFIIDVGKSQKHLFDKDSTHKHRYTLDEMRGICKRNGFEIILLDEIKYRSKRTLKLIKHKLHKTKLIAVKQ